MDIVPIVFKDIMLKMEFALLRTIIVNSMVMLMGITNGGSAGLMAVNVSVKNAMQDITLIITTNANYYHPTAYRPIKTASALNASMDIRYKTEFAL